MPPPARCTLCQPSVRYVDQNTLGHVKYPVRYGQVDITRVYYVNASPVMSMRYVKVLCQPRYVNQHLRCVMSMTCPLCQPTYIGTPKIRTGLCQFDHNTCILCQPRVDYVKCVKTHMFIWFPSDICVFGVFHPYSHMFTTGEHGKLVSFLKICK